MRRARARGGGIAAGGRMRRKVTGPSGAPGEQETSSYKRAMRKGGSNIMVAVRVRPLSRSEEATSKPVVDVISGKMVVARDPGRAANDVLRANRSREKQYAFDHAFGPEVGQEGIYSKTTAFLLDGVLDGYNASVFAYGQTGSGKTYTMLGTLEEPGIMVHALEELFRAMEKRRSEHRVEFKVTLHMIEVYNENIRDLLVDGSDSLDLREDPIKGPTVAGVTELEAKDTAGIMSLLAAGNRRRTQEPTAANAESSRSHAVLQIVVEQRAKGAERVKVGKLSMIDLAGSERAARTENRGLRLLEGANINRSLLALGNCINALATNSKGAFVPYRDSKLTRLLKDSLGGNCRTVMIATASPAASSFEETVNTLKYADRAKHIKVRATRNVLKVDYHISQYEELIANLRGEIRALRSKIPGEVEGDDGGKEEEDEDEDLFGGGIGMERGAKEAKEDDGKTRASKSGAPKKSVRIEKPKSRTEPDDDDDVDDAEVGLDLGEEGEEETEGRGRPSSGVRMRGLREAIVRNFDERMNLKRSLVDLDSMDAKNKAEAAKRQMEIARAEDHLRRAGAARAAGMEPPAPLDVTGAPALFTGAAAAASQVDALRAKLRSTRETMARNARARAELKARLAENSAEAARLRKASLRGTTNAERRDLLTLQYRVGSLELEKLELEQARMLHDHEVRQRDLAMRKLRLRLRARDRIISELSRVITQHNLTHLVDPGAVAAVDAELESDLDEEEEDDLEEEDLDEEEEELEDDLEADEYLDGEDDDHETQEDQHNHPQKLPDDLLDDEDGVPAPLDDGPRSASKQPVRQQRRSPNRPTPPPASSSRSHDRAAAALDLDDIRIEEPHPPRTAWELQDSPRGTLRDPVVLPPPRATKDMPSAPYAPSNRRVRPPDARRAILHARGPSPINVRPTPNLLVAAGRGIASSSTDSSSAPSLPHSRSDSKQKRDQHSSEPRYAHRKPRVADIPGLGIRGDRIE